MDIETIKSKRSSMNFFENCTGDFQCDYLIYLARLWDKEDLLREHLKLMENFKNNKNIKIE